MRVAYLGNMRLKNTRIWIEEMAARGVEPVALDPSRPDWDIEWARLEIRRPRVRGLGLGTRSIGRSISEIAAMHRTDVIHTHQANDAAAWVQASGVRPHIITCWGSDVMRLDKQPRSRRIKVRRALRNADAVTVGSRSLLEAAVHAGARGEHIETVGWGVDTQTYRPRAGMRARVRAHWGFQDRVVVLSTRKLEPLYRVDAILRAFAVARHSFPELALVVVSSGTQAERLRELAEKLGIADNTRFLGPVTEDAWPTMGDVCSGADIYVSVPETDGGPLSVLEAMATGLPVVASDIPVMREWVQVSQSGTLWAGDDPSALAERMLQVVPRREELGHHAREFVVAHHERSTEMDRARELYDRMLAEGRR